jgi:hypothetical protein
MGEIFVQIDFIVTNNARYCMYIVYILKVVALDTRNLIIFVRANTYTASVSYRRQAEKKAYISVSDRI